MKIALSSIVLVAGSLAVGCVVDTTPAQSPPPPPMDPAAPPPAAAAVAPPAAAPAAAPIAAPVAEPAQPAYAPPPRPAEPPAEHHISEAAGEPPGMRPGAPLAIWIWQDAGGANWHLRTTTELQSHRFTGRIWPAAGSSLAGVRAARVEHTDRVRQEGTELTFDMTTKGDMDGLDFNLAGRCVAFYVTVDGKADPGRVFIGAQNHHPKAPAFTLCR